MDPQGTDLPPTATPDCRLYLPDPRGWEPRILTSADKIYCFAKNPGEDYYHLILTGELYLQRGNEVYCLRCALRQGIATQNRLFWQRNRPFEGV